MSFFFFCRGCGKYSVCDISSNTPTPVFSKAGTFFEFRFIGNNFFGFSELVRSNHDPSLLYAELSSCEAIESIWSFDFVYME